MENNQSNNLDNLKYQMLKVQESLRLCQSLEEMRPVLEAIGDMKVFIRQLEDEAEYKRLIFENRKLRKEMNEIPLSEELSMAEIKSKLLENNERLKYLDGRQLKCQSIKALSGVFSQTVLHHKKDLFQSLISRSNF